jgi:glutathione S-transferase
MGDKVVKSDAAWHRQPAVATFTLVVGNKNYSSWSLRPWLAMRQAGIAFEEIVIPLYQAESKAALLAHSPAGKVPVLKHGDRTVWDTLAIMEYLAETFPAAGLWPQDAAARALARSISAEMHAGFAALRRGMPMNLRDQPPRPQGSDAVAADIERITAIWRDCRTRFGAGASFLFGAFSAADAMYAPVATRFRTYGVALDPVCQAYADALLDLPAFLEWQRAARQEPWVITRYANPARPASDA